MLLPWLALLALGSEPANCPEFRSHGGVFDTSGLPVEWSEKQNIRWKTPIHGKGWSSPVSWGSQIWLTTAPEDGKELYAVCIDAKSGKVVHDVKVFDVEAPEFCHETNSYASCTPAVEDGRLYVHFGSYGTAALDTATGKTLWERRDLPCDHFRGPASSVAIFGDLLYINFDGVDIQYVVALDKKTGATVWKKDRDINYGSSVGDAKKAYSTPTVVRVGGRDELISPAAVETIAYDPKNGDEIWRVRHGGMNAGARPLYVNGLVYILSGGGGNLLTAVRPDGKGNVTKSHVAWKSSDKVPLKGSPVVVGDLMFLASDNGILSCRDAASGTMHWQKRVGKSYWASPIAAGGRVYFLDQDGFMPVVEAKKEFRQLALNRLDQGGNSSPIVVDDALIVRTRSHLYRIQR